MYCLHLDISSSFLSQGEPCQDYHAYKVAAIQCENKLAEQRRLKHKKLLNKVAELDRTLKVALI